MDKKTMVRKSIRNKLRNQNNRFSANTTKILQNYLAGQPGMGGQTERKELLKNFNSFQKGVFVIGESDLREIARRHREVSLLTSFHWHIERYTLPSEDFLNIVKYQLPDLYVQAKEGKLPEFVILLREPNPNEMATRSIEYFRRYFWSILFLVEIHKFLISRQKHDQLSVETIHNFIAGVGIEVLEEARVVMKEENIFLDLDNEADIVCSFVAFFLHLYIFSPQILGDFFPRINDPNRIYQQIVNMGVSERDLLEKSRPPESINVDELLVFQKSPLRNSLFTLEYHRERICTAAVIHFPEMTKEEFLTKYRPLLKPLLNKNIRNNLIGEFHFAQLVEVNDNNHLDFSQSELLRLDYLLADALPAIYQRASKRESLAFSIIRKPREKTTKEIIEECAVAFRKTADDIQERAEKPSWLLLFWAVMTTIRNFCSPWRILVSPHIFQYWSSKAKWRLYCYRQRLFKISLYLSEYQEKRGNIAVAFIERHKALRLWQSIHRQCETTPGKELYDFLEERLKENLAFLKNSFCQEHNIAEDMQETVDEMLQHIHRQTDLKPHHQHILQDLQKSYIDAEKNYFQVHPLRWIFTFGTMSFSDPLPELPKIKGIRALRSLLRRLNHLQTNEQDLQRFVTMLRSTIHHCEDCIREEYRPLIRQALLDSGFSPETQQGQVALQKIQEEILDEVIQRGRLQFSTLRDVVSRNDLKLYDLQKITHFVLGDQLLRLDRNISKVFPGVHRRAEIYMHLLHRLSSLLFGLPTGRYLFLYLLAPFGGAYVLFEFLLYLLGIFHKAHLPIALISPVFQKLSSYHWLFLTKLSYVLSLGFFILFFFFTKKGRETGKKILLAIGRFFRSLFLFFPKLIWRLRLVQLLYRNRLWLFVYLFLVRPAIWSSFIVIPLLLLTNITSAVLWYELWGASILILDILYYTAPGKLLFDRLAIHTRYFLVRFNTTVFIGLFHFLIDFFRQVLQWAETVFYVIDDFFRFRRQDHWLAQLIKALLGKIWYGAAYILRFILNLIVEPQLNPLKHFPMVTVSHKIIFPLSPMITSSSRVLIEPVMGDWTHIGMAGVFMFVQFGLPGICGFVVWEFRENWKLYRRTAPLHIQPAIAGGHGETIPRMLKKGFHSGTIPRLFHKLRKANMRGVSHKGNWQSWYHLKEQQHHICQSLTEFIERCFCAEFTLNERMQQLISSCEVHRVEISVCKITVFVAIVSPDETVNHLTIHLAIHRSVLYGYVTKQQDFSPELQSYLDFALKVLFERADIEVISNDMPMSKSSLKKSREKFHWEEYFRFLEGFDGKSNRI